MTIIQDKEFGGERPLYHQDHLQLEGVTIHVGESSIKECRVIRARNCRFEGKYVFWETKDFRAEDCVFTPSARSSLWYSRKGLLRNCQVDAPKMFRRMLDIQVYNCTFSDAQEMLWDCSNITMCDVTTQNADYLGTHAQNVSLTRFQQNGNYAFQYGQDIVIRDSVLNSKDALWECKNVHLINCEINGEYFAWYAQNLTLENCHITGEQPLCYCHNLVMKNCTMGDDANLAFEYSSVKADIRGHIVSVKNPTSGYIHADSIGEIILDENQRYPRSCEIKAPSPALPEGRE